MRKPYIILAMAVALSACTSEQQLKKALKNNPDILVEAIKANPGKIMMALQEASQLAQEDMAKQRLEDALDEAEKDMEKPLEPELTKADLLAGPEKAPLTLVIYSDFECPYCGRGFVTEKALMDKYKDKIQVYFKNLPLPMHPHAMIAAQYFEALRLQSPEKAEKFHNEIFTNQRDLQKGESFLKATAKKVGADMSKLAKDVKSSAVKKTIQADMDEASKFGFEGTPGYILNGVPVRGAYPQDFFEKLVERMEKKGKVTL